MVIADRTPGDAIPADGVIEDAHTDVQTTQPRLARIQAGHATSADAAFHGAALQRRRSAAP